MPSPDELLDQLSALGVKWSRSTLLRAVNDKLGPEPQTGAGGRGYGRWSEYEPTAFAEFYASHIMQKVDRMGTAEVVQARKTVKEYQKQCKDIGDLIYGPGSEYEIAQDTTMKEDAQVLKDTPGALRWWELKQAAAAKIDEEYAGAFYYLELVARVDAKIETWKPRLIEILEGIQQIEKMDTKKKMVLNAWLRVIEQNPVLRPQTRAGVLAEFRSIPDSVLQFLAYEKLP